MPRFYFPMFPSYHAQSQSGTRPQAKVEAVALSQSQCCPLPTGPWSCNAEPQVAEPQVTESSLQELSQEVRHHPLHFSISSTSTLLLQPQHNLLAYQCVKEMFGTRRKLGHLYTSEPHLWTWQKCRTKKKNIFQFWKHDLISGVWVIVLAAGGTEMNEMM